MTFLRMLSFFVSFFLRGRGSETGIGWRDSRRESREKRRRESREKRRGESRRGRSRRGEGRKGMTRDVATNACG